MLTTLLAGCAAPTLASRDAPAAAPAYVAAFQERLANATTIYALVPYRRHEREPSFTAVSELAVRLDLPARRAAIQTGGNVNFVYMDGVFTVSSPHFAVGHPGVRSPTREPVFAALLAELDAGLANTTFTPEFFPDVASRRSGNPLTGKGGSFRLDLPGVWDDGWRIYMEISDDPSFACAAVTVAVFEKDRPRVVQLPGIRADFALCNNVQWEPDWTESTYGAPEPWSTRTCYWPGFEPDEYGGLAPYEAP
jgi:hypothetical protein